MIYEPYIFSQVDFDRSAGFSHPQHVVAYTRLRLLYSELGIPSPGWKKIYYLPLSRVEGNRDLVPVYIGLPPPISPGHFELFEPANTSAD